MNAPLTQPVAPTARPLPPMNVLVKGRIDAVRRYEKTTYTRIISPAPDPYSRPQTVEIRSKQRLGQTGEEIAVHAVLGGYTRKAFRSTDKETGETTLTVPVDLTLDAVE